MTYIDSLKERIRPFKTRDPDDIAAERIKNNPDYAQALIKLKELYAKRTLALDRLEKIELDIDACLLLLAMNEKKVDIDSRNV